MALPQKIKVNDITGASSPDLIDNDLNAGIKQPLLDIFGIPDNTNIAAAGLTFVAGGLDRVIFQDAVADPTTAGHLRRNGANLLFHDGTAARAMVGVATTQTLTNKTLTAPAISAPVFSGSATGTYTLAGTPTITAPAISSPVLSGTATGTYALAGTPTITAPAISDPVLSGTSTGTYTLAGTPTVSSAINLTSGQIAFPATQVPSAGANTLDDYEEGTWTPSLGGTTTYFLQSGAYVKIGNTVFVQGRLTVNAIGTGSTSVISGLPFTAAAQVAGSCDFSNLALSVTTVVPRVVASGTTITFVSLTAAGTSLAVNAIFGANSAVTFSMFYTI